MRRQLTTAELRDIAAVAALSAADVFLGPSGHAAIVAGMERRALRSRGRALGLGDLGTKPIPGFDSDPLEYCHKLESGEIQTLVAVTDADIAACYARAKGVPTPAEYEATTSPIDPEVNAVLYQRALDEGTATEETWHDVRVANVTPEVLDFLMAESEKMAMVGIEPLFSSESDLRGWLGEPGINLMLELYGVDRPHAPAIGTEFSQRIGRMLNIPAGLVKVYQEVLLERQRSRSPGGGIIGKALVAITDAIQWDKVRDLKSWLNSTLRLAALVYGAAAAGSAIGGGGASASSGSAAASSAAPGAAASSTAAAAPAATSTAAATGAASGGGTILTTAATTGGGAIKTLIDKAKTVAPKVVEGVNTARTIEAVAKGEIPPPPIDIGSGSMTDWASAIAEQYVAGQLSDAEKKVLEQQLRLLQGDARPYAAPDQLAPSSGVPPEVQAAMLERAPWGDNMLLLLAIGVPALFFALSEARS